MTAKAAQQQQQQQQQLPTGPRGQRPPIGRQGAPVQELAKAKTAPSRESS
jgi:hypothetical protein